MTRAGEPMISEFSGNSLPVVTTEPAPTMQPRRISAPFNTIAPMPTSAPSSTVQPCRMALWPMVQFFPIVSGKPAIGVAGAIVLDVGALAELDPFVVAAQHRAEPDAGALLQSHLADHGCGVGDEKIAVGGKIGPLPVEFVDRHALKVSFSRQTLAQQK